MGASQVFNRLQPTQTLAAIGEQVDRVPLSREPMERRLKIAQETEMTNGKEDLHSALSGIFTSYRPLTYSDKHAPPRSRLGGTREVAAASVPTTRPWCEFRSESRGQNYRDPRRSRRSDRKPNPSDVGQYLRRN